MASNWSALKIYSPQYLYNKKKIFANQVGILHTEIWMLDVSYSDLATQGNLSLIGHFFPHYCPANSLAWRRLMLLCVTCRGMPAVWSSSARVQKIQQLTDQDPDPCRNAQMHWAYVKLSTFKWFLGTPCAHWQRQLLWSSLKTWAHKWQDMFWLLESLHIPLNTIPFFLYRPINSFAVPN